MLIDPSRYIHIHVNAGAIIGGRSVEAVYISCTYFIVHYYYYYYLQQLV